MHVERHVEALRVRPVQETRGIGGERRRPLPAVPGVRRLEVRVDDEHVERHVVVAKLIDQALIVRGAVEEVAREPDPERLARQQRRGPGQGPEVVQGADVVGPVGEQVAVLVGPGALAAAARTSARPRSAAGWSCRRAGTSRRARAARRAAAPGRAGCRGRGTSRRGCPGCVAPGPGPGSRASPAAACLCRGRTVGPPKLGWTTALPRPRRRSARFEAANGPLPSR